MTPPAHPPRGWTARLLGKLLCAIGSHPCMTNSDDSGVWGECVRCHRRFGYVDRATLRRYADAEAARERESGVCDVCWGSGKNWSHQLWPGCPCRICNGTGKLPDEPRANPHPAAGEGDE